MSLGLTVFTLVHVVISLIGIVSGLVVVYGFLAANSSPFPGWFIAVTYWNAFIAVQAARESIA